jgi:hypothetical protein
MRAQIGLDFVLALILFITISTYLGFHVLRIMPIYLEKARLELLREEAYRLSQLLINDGGHPLDWPTYYELGLYDDIKRVGLSNHSFNLTNLLSMSKVQALDQACDEDYDYVRLWTGVDHEFSANLTDLDGNVLLDCIPPRKGFEMRVGFRRVVALDDGSKAMLSLGVWR